MSDLRIAPAAVERLLERLYLAGGGPRDEERKKAREVSGLLGLLARAQPQPAPRGKPRLLVDAAAGHGYVGLCAAALLGWRRVVAIERDAARAARVRAAARKLDVAIELHVEVGDVRAFPERPDVVIALHACGPATDAVIDAAIAAQARWILSAPCCYGAAIPGWAAAMAEAAALGLPDDAVTRARFAALRIDAQRLNLLRAAGYEASLRAFAPPTVTPHHLVVYARRGGAR